MTKTAILIDGGFYRKRAKFLWGDKPPEGRATELRAYCRAHMADSDNGEARHLYRIFYYDCEPAAGRTVFHPLRREYIDLNKTDTFVWVTAFIEHLKQFRKFALRLGQLSEDMHYNLRPDVTEALCAGRRTVDTLTDQDFVFVGRQKGVDMKIGVDIASLAYKRLADQIILIAGDSDFVPAAKLARREGIDFILDPMWSRVRPDLFEHIDGLKSCWKKKVYAPDTGEKPAGEST